MSAPPTTASSLSSSGFEDGLGRRVLAFDRETGDMLERLVVRPELGAFEKVLAQRINLLTQLEDERFARPRGIEDDDEGRLTVVSEFVAGRRLSDALDAAQDAGIVPGLDAALGLLLELLPALANLHGVAGFAHGAISPARMILSPAGQIVLVDPIYGAALERLAFNRQRLWNEFGIAVPPSAGPARFDMAADLTQAGMTAAALIVGRRLGAADYPNGIQALRAEILEVAQIRGTAKFASGIEKFFDRVLPIAGRKAFPSADDAVLDLRQLVRKEIGVEACRTALLDFFQQVETAEIERTAAEEAMAAERETERLEQGRLDADRRERAKQDAERRAREEAEARERARIEAERREKERLEAERRERERVEAERRERERLEAERREKERLEKERLEAEARERARIEAERREQERLEAERLEAERLEAERLEAERRERERLEAERREKERLEAERRERERLEAEQRERERLEAERLERERIERERLEAEQRERERLEAERLEQERLERERIERERLEAELRERARLEAERREKERLERERIERERLEAEQRERARLEAERLEKERLERERLERERLEAERRERERLEAERRERERLEAERLERERQARLEAERKEKERLEAERKERERLEAERRERERLEAERLERERQARLEAERKEKERLEAARRERERLEAERKERERLEAERKQRERLEAERLERERQARLEAERKEKERLETERREQERAEKERRERERAEAERREKERAAAERREQDRREQERREQERREQEQRELEQREQEELAAADERESASQSNKRRKRDKSARSKKDRLRSTAPASSGPTAPTPAPVPAAAASKSSWLVPPDRAAAFEPPVAPVAPAAPMPDAVTRGYPVYMPPAQQQPAAVAAPIPPPLVVPPPVVPPPVMTPSIPIGFAPPKPVPQPQSAPIGLAQPTPIKLKHESHSAPSPAFTPRRDRDVAFIPEVSANPTDTGRGGIPWKIAAAVGALLAIGIAGSRFLPSGTTPPNTTVTGKQADRGPEPTTTTIPKNAGQIVITTDPAGARVLLDGKPVGESPVTLPSVTPGRHTITLITETGNVKKTVRVEGGKSLSLDVPIFSGFAAVSAPIVVEVSEGGRLLGTSENSIMLSPGKHQLKFTNNALNYQGSQTIEIDPGETFKISLDPRGTANINAQPWAEVWIDGVKAGETPIANVSIALGVREIVFRNPQFGERKLVTTITGGGPAALSVDFTKQ